MSVRSANSNDPRVQSPLLEAKLRRMRTRIRWTEGSRRLAILLGAILLLIGFSLLLDWLLDLPVAVREVVLALEVLVVAGMGAWSVAGLVTRKQRDPETLALMVERAVPQFRGRLIASVQFALGHGTIPTEESVAQVERLKRETEAIATPSNFQRAINFKPWQRASAFALVVAVGFLGTAIIGGRVIDVLLDRHLLANEPIPRQTRITKVQYDPRLGIGDVATVVIQASGKLPERGRLHVRYDSGQRTVIPLLADDRQKGAYHATLASVPGSFTWRARLNDARTREHRVTAIPRPSVMSLTLTQRYPEFMKSAPTTHAPGDFHLFPGATVDLEIQASKAVQSGSLALLGLNQEVVLKPDPAKADRLQVSLTVPPDELSGFSIDLQDREGMHSRELAAYRVTLARDVSPEIRLVLPARSDESVVPTAELLLAWKAADRFGVREFELCYRRGETNGTQRLPVALPADADPRDARVEFRWRLDEVEPSLQAGEQLDVWVEAMDVNPATPPGATRRLRLAVVTAEEKRRQLLARVADTIGRLEPIAHGQEQLNETLSDVIKN